MPRNPVVRFSVSMPAALAARLDDLVRASAAPSRSHALADLVRARLTDRAAERPDARVTGTVTLVYDHHRRNVQALLTTIQHDHPGLVLSTLHVHLDHDRCLEVLAVRGRAADVRRIADRLVACRGVDHGRLTLTSAARPHG